ncbi:Arm DNA-binding domain-containing protein [Alcaligenes sp. Marseille-Q7550]
MGGKREYKGVRPEGDAIQVDFRWKGRRLRPTLNLKPTAANLRHAERIRADILQDIRRGEFNIHKYFPDYKHADDHAPANAGASRTLRDWAAVWASLAARSLDDSTIRIYKRHLNAYWLAPFGDEMPAAITHEKILTHLALLSTERIDEVTGKVKRPLAAKTQNNILIPLKSVFELICKADRSIDNPTEGIENIRTQKALPDPFSLEEIEVILATLVKQQGKEMADYFEFATFAGLRPSEQIALLWEDVDLRSGVVVVRRSRVLATDKERTKTKVRREVELNARALAVIERQRPRTQMAGEHVFRCPSTGKPWHDDQVQRRVWEQALKLARVRHRPPKECRDTSVTLALLSGADPVWVAKQHGHSLTVMMRDYAKWIAGADRGRNLAAMNRMYGQEKAVWSVDGQRNGTTEK